VCARGLIGLRWQIRCLGSCFLCQRFALEGYSDSGSSGEADDPMGCLSDVSESVRSVVSMPPAVCAEVLAEMMAERETAP
jgi:hypothetical protein